VGGGRCRGQPTRPAPTAAADSRRSASGPAAGPAVTEAPRQLDQATTAAWQALSPVEPTDDELRLVERATGIDRGWDAAYRLVSTLDPPGQGRSPA
jgi:hypothetical protein